MNININGQSKTCEDGSTLASLVHQFSPNNPRVITELNGAIIAQDQWQTTTLNDNDTVELVAFVGGG